MTVVSSTIRSGAQAPAGTIPLLGAAILTTSLGFYVFPGVDLAVSAWFHSSDGFVLANALALRLLRASSTWVLVVVVLAALAQILRHALAGRDLRHQARRSIWLLAGLAAGPGILVNGVLKSVWGRPRPVATDIFGGEAPFQKAWVISDWCERNCSFASGEAASAAWLVAAAMIAPGSVRPFAVGLAAIYAAALSVNRIAFGGHYLSDVVLAWLLCALVFMVLHRLLVDSPGDGVPAMPARAAPELHY